jgi:hypothetical protein
MRGFNQPIKVKRSSKRHVDILWRLAHVNNEALQRHGSKIMNKQRTKSTKANSLIELLSVETHRRVATGNTKSREVAEALAGTAPSSTARNSVTHPEVLWKTGRAT